MKINARAKVTLIFSLLALCSTLLGVWLGMGFETKFFSVYRTSAFDPMQYVRLFSFIFGHAGLGHYLGNFLFILILGPLVEEKFGSGNFLLMILITALVTGLLSVIFFPDVQLLGASGIVFMLILLSAFTFAGGEGVPLTFILVVLLYLGREVYNAVFVQDQVSQFAHIVGGLCGGMFGYITKRRG